MLQFRVESLEKDSAAHQDALRKAKRQLDDVETAAKERAVRVKAEAKADEDELRRRVSELETLHERAVEAAENAKEGLESVREVSDE